VYYYTNGCSIDTNECTIHTNEYTNECSIDTNEYTTILMGVLLILMSVLQY